MDHLVGETVAVRTYGEPSRDHRGRLVPGKAVDVEYNQCVVYQKDAGEGERDPVVVSPDYREIVVMFPTVVGLEEGDIVVVHGVEMKVQPHPVVWSSPFGTGRGGTEVIVRRDEA